MRKINFLKVVLGVAAAMLITVGAFGQNPPVPYGVYDANLTAPTNIDYVTFKGAPGTTMGYFVLPDPVYHPNYPATGVLTDDFTWDWTVVSDPGTAPTITPGALDLSNYATILYPAIGHYSLTVAETAPAAMGGCADATPTELEVEVIAAPTGTTSIAPVGLGWQIVVANQSYQVCGAQAAQTVTIAFNEAVPDNLASFAFEITETIEQLNGLGAVIATPQAEAIIEDFDLTHKVKATELDGADVTILPGAAFTAATPNFSFAFSSDALALTQNAGLDVRTRYTYKVRRTGSLVTGTDYDFLSNISQKSDFLAGAGNEVYYAFTNNTVAFTINPAPATGPIYYVPNTYNY